MANIKKSFSFRNGVQVDDDNFLVNPTGLVGIGTTVPTEALDVRGKVKVIGEVNATSGLITSLVISDTLQVNNLDFAAGEIGAGISVGTAGVITATSSAGLVTYYGDGKNLLNLPTSQWLDKDVGLGYTSIYSQGAVGIATVDPRFFLQIGGNESNNLATFKAGVGFNSTGDVVATGIVTAGIGFTGDLRGNIVSGLSTFTQLEASNVNVTGIITAIEGENVIPFYYLNQSNLPDPLTNKGAFAQVFTTNRAYFADSGYWKEIVNRESNGTVGTGTDNYNVDIVTANVVTTSSGIGFTGNLVGDVNSAGISTFNQLKVTGGISGDTVSGILTTGQLQASASQIGIATASSIDIVEKLAVGTNNPSKNVEIFNVGITTVDVIGEEFAIVQLGQRSSIGIGESTAQIKFGEADKSFELINGDTGNFNSVIHGANFQGIATGGFNWIYGGDGSTLMNLDYKGNLGIGKTLGMYPLDVVGVATFGNDVFVKNNLEVANTLKVLGNLDVSGSSTFTLPDLIQGSNINVNTGISSFLKINVAESISGVATIGIGTWISPNGMGIDAPNAVVNFQQVGIGSTQPSSTLDVGGSGHIKQFFGVGNVEPGAAVDFSSAGRGMSIAPLQNRMFMVPPKVTTTERNNLAGLVAGAMIYNTSTNNIQFYNGSSWSNL